MIGKAWDDSLGGLDLDLRLTELLAERFNEIWNNQTKSGPMEEILDIAQFPRPMTRLRKEANRIKEFLSANNEFQCEIEKFHENLDLNTKITR